MDQNRLRGVINQINQAGIGEHLYCILCGRMTPDQKQIVRKRLRINTQLYIDILSWFVKESGHPGYLNTSIPEDCPQPLLVEDTPTKNNTDDPSNKSVNQVMKAGRIIFPLRKTHRNIHLCMVHLIFLPLPYFSILCQHYWHTVVHMPKMLI